MLSDSVEIRAALERLENWFEINGLDGWDPYDIQDSKLFRAIERYFPNVLGRVLIRLMSEISFFFPLFSRRALGVKKSVNNKGLGLMLSSYLSRYQITKNPRDLERAIRVADHLEANFNSEYSGRSWGYPFDWLSPIMIPAGVPSSVVTSIVGDGFYRLYLVTHKQKYLEICENICVFFMNDLKITYGSDDSASVCYSYTPLDDYQVHNANLFIAEFLVRIGKLTNKKSLVEVGVRCANFAVEQQTKEGFIPYWGLSQTEKYSHGRVHTDHYHCGFEIRSLQSIWLNTNMPVFRVAFEKYFAWYKANMFSVEKVPKYNSKSIYPYNIHTCAESILCLSRTSRDTADKKYLIEMTNSIIKEMEFSPGEYTHIIKCVFDRFEARSNIPLLRWGQAWMFLALAELVCLLDEEEK